MDYLEVQRFIRRYYCRCGNTLSFRVDPDGNAKIMCPGNPDHKEFVKQKGVYQRYEEGESIPLHIAQNIERKEEQRMTEELGKEKSTALMEYRGVTALTVDQAGFVLRTLYPRAPADALVRGAMFCAQYGLNPLRRHVFLMCFNEGKPNESWELVESIKATRLIGSRKHEVSYLDGTPRVMTEQEQLATFAEVDEENIVAMTILQDVRTGATARGYGRWPRKDKPYGTEKGNTKFNMASIRSERQAYERLCPGEMPEDMEVIDDAFIEGEFNEVTKESLPTSTKPRCPKHNKELVKGKYGWYCPTKVPGTKGREVFCKGVAPAGEEPVVKPEPSPEEIGVATPTTEELPRPEDIKNLGALFTASAKYFRLSPQEVLGIIDVSSRTEIADAGEAWRKIVEVKTHGRDTEG